MEEDSDDLKCPVCFEIINSPVFQCANGHLICGQCLDDIERQPRPSSRRCPVCRQTFAGPRIRNLFAERRAAKRARTGRTEDEDASLLVGVWHYTTPKSDCVSSYMIEVDSCGRVRVSGTLSDGISSSGVLERQGDWHQGDVRYGVVRVQRQGQHLVSNIRAWGATTWGPTVRAHRCEVMGMWFYTIPNTDRVSSYVVDSDADGRVRMSETLSNGSVSSGFLEKQGDWYQGDLSHGTVRLRLEGQHVFSNFQALGTDTWGPDIRAHRCGVLGTWCYSVPDSDSVASLLIDADEYGHVRISETSPSCSTSACLLEKQGDWHQGSLKHREIRVRREGQRVVLSFRAQGATEWGPELCAHRLAEHTSDGVVCICD